MLRITMPTIVKEGIHMTTAAIIRCNEGTITAYDKEKFFKKKIPEKIENIAFIGFITFMFISYYPQIRQLAIDIFGAWQ